MFDETIVAIATPPGRGAIAVIRVSGPQSHAISARHISPWPIAARRATLATVRDGDGSVVDQALVTAFEAPASFTGESMVEIATHGGLVVPNLVLSAFISSGARIALPGEFTRRAVLNGKIDLVEAEAIGDLIDAKSRAMHKAAVHQLSGNLSCRINALRNEIIHLQALIAYDIDFPEEDDGPVSSDRIENTLREIIQGLDALLATAQVGELIRDGAVVVIAGPPNAGKSSLFNALLGTERAIVTDIPGTTRDAIEVVIDTGVWPLRLVDTAGLRDTSDTVERLGIEVSARYLASADIVLACGDSDISVKETLAIVLGLTDAEKIPVLTKADQIDTLTYQSDQDSNGDIVPVSALTGDGIPDLLQRIHTVLANQLGTPQFDAPIITRERQRFALQTARAELATFADVWRSGEIPATAAATMLNSATHALEDVIGAVDVEDVFDKLFQTFCVGK